MMHRLCFTAALLGACAKPPPAPEGLDESARYLVREFYADDPTFQAGVQGFLDWYADEGEALLTTEQTIENTGSFTVGDLSEEDVALLPLSDEVIIGWQGDEAEYIARDIAAPAGVVSLAEMDCSVREAEELLTRADQDAVFCGDWQDYSRSYVTDDDAYTSGWDASDFTNIRDPLDPFGGDFDGSAQADVILLTDNDVDPTPVLGGLADIETYPMDLHFRHGRYELGEELRDAFIILTFTRDAAWGEAKNNALIQSYSIEINVALDDDTTLRMLTVWAEPKGGGIPADSPTALNFALKKATASSDRLSRICAGEIPVSDTDSCEE
jgi:hypothetical protein